MKILLTTPYKIWPTNYGGAVRTVEIARALGRSGHKVEVLSADQAIPGHLSYRSFLAVGYFFNPFFIGKLKRSIAEFAPDLIVAAFPYQSAMLVPIARRHGIPLIYDAHNIESLRFARLKKPLQGWIVRFFEKLMIRNADVVLCVSQHEARYVNENFTTPAVLLPNGVNIQHRPAGSTREYAFCFFGALDYRPNVIALEFLREIWPRIREQDPDISLLLAGRNPPEWAEEIPGWIVTGELEDIPEAISKARILLCPLSEGGGSRLKIIEAVANGLLVVSTRFGAEGFEDLEKEGAIVISSLEKFADTALAMNRKPIDHRTIAKSADRYDWNSLVEEIEKLESLLKLTGTQSG